MRAAVANGADAVYFGLDDFNARRRAANFPLSRLPDILDDLHDHNVRGYVALNTLVFEGELDAVAGYVAAIARSGADAVIVQDLGVARLVRAMCPTLPIHASTQTTQTHLAGLALLATLGIQRVILARELSLSELAAIRRATRMDLEVFVHGALCISYSGQCLASEALWGRSGNRGTCAQACRLPYELLVDGEMVNADRRYPLSPTDLCALEHIGELVALGVTGFKIEGRLKDAHYVAATTRIYREAIDAAVADRPFEITAEHRRWLTQSFSRGFTSGFLKGRSHQSLVDGRSPKPRGQLLGRVVGVTGKAVHVVLESAWPGDGTSAPVAPGDGVVFDEGRPDQSEQGGRVYSVDDAGNDRSGPVVILTFGRDDLDPAKVAEGALVWKTDDPPLRRAIQQTFSRAEVRRRVPITFEVTACEGAKLRIAATDGEGHHAEAASDEPVSAARNRPVTVDLLAEQLGRLGNTAFVLDKVTLTDGTQSADTLPIMVPKSVLNTLRRGLVDALIDQRRRAGRHAISEPGALARLRDECSKGSVSRSSGSRLNVLVRDMAQLRAALAWTAPASEAAIGTVYIDFPIDPSGFQRVVADASAGMVMALATPRVLHPDEERLLEVIQAGQPGEILVRNLAGLYWLRQRSNGSTLIGDFSLNAVNGLSSSLLAELGLARVTVGCDLNDDQLAALAAASPGTPFEVIAHGHVPMFHTAHCLAAAHLSAGDDCRHCGRPCRTHTIELRDRQGATHPLMTDAAGRNTVYLGPVQTGVEAVARWVSDPSLPCIARWRLEFLNETPAVVTATLDIYARLLAGDVSADGALRGLGRLYPAGTTHGTWSFA